MPFPESVKILGTLVKAGSLWSIVELVLVVAVKVPVVQINCAVPKEAELEGPVVTLIKVAPL